jgi:hypothetical protein
VYREKPLEAYRANARRSVAPRIFMGERNFKKIPNFRNQSAFTCVPLLSFHLPPAGLSPLSPVCRFAGMDGHSFVNNARLRYSTTSVIAHSNEAVTKIGTENPSITSQLVRLIHKKTFK